MLIMHMAFSSLVDAFYLRTYNNTAKSFEFTTKLTLALGKYADIFLEFWHFPEFH